MKYADYAKWTNRATQWIENHFATMREKPVRAQTQIGDIAARLPASPPEHATDMETIIADFEKIAIKDELREDITKGNAAKLLGLA